MEEYKDDVIENILDCCEDDEETLLHVYQKIANPHIIDDLVFVIADKLHDMDVMTIKSILIGVYDVDLLLEELKNG